MQVTSEEKQDKKANQANDSLAAYNPETKDGKNKLGTELTAVASANENSSGIPSPY